MLALNPTFALEKAAKKLGNKICTQIPKYEKLVSSVVKKWLSDHKTGFQTF
jgi:hypothetical protein